MQAPSSRHLDALMPKKLEALTHGLEMESLDALLLSHPLGILGMPLFLCLHIVHVVVGAQRAPKNSLVRFRPPARP